MASGAAPDAASCLDKWVRANSTSDALPVVRRDTPTQVIGYVERAGVMAAWVASTRSEETREEGWLSGQLRMLQERVRQALTRAD